MASNPSHCVRPRDGSTAERLNLPALAAGVVVLFAVMPTGANAKLAPGVTILPLHAKVATLP